MKGARGMVTVRYTVTTADAAWPELWLANRLLAYRPSRRERVRLGRKVRVVRGGFPPRNDSVKYVSLGGVGTVLEISDFPASLAAQLGLEVVGD